MEPDEYEWYINLVKDRFSTLKLSREQALRIFEFERDRDNYSEKHQFSPWEEWDYELFVFRDILDKEQFDRHEKWLREAIATFEEGLKEVDKKATNEISYYQAINDYYQQHFIPAITKIETNVLLGVISSDKAKIVLLKEEYKKYLNDQKKQILTSHFRYNRHFQPNLLKVSLLNHNLSYLWPEFESFKHHMDDATKAVSDHLYKKLKLISEAEIGGLNKCFEELKTFQESNFEKHYGDRKGGWSVIFGDQDEEEIRKNSIMSLILIEKEGYNT